jgi:hypothetical protein
VAREPAVAPQPGCSGASTTGGPRTRGIELSHGSGHNGPEAGVDPFEPFDRVTVGVVRRIALGQAIDCLFEFF